MIGWRHAQWRPMFLSISLLVICAISDLHAQSSSKDIFRSWWTTSWKPLSIEDRIVRKFAD